MASLGVVLMVQLAMAIMALITSPDDSAYYHAHSSLFIVSFVVVLAFIILKKKMRIMLRHMWSTFSHPNQVTLREVVDTMRIVMFGAALVSLIFVVDFDFVGHGFRIGGAAAVSLCTVGKAIVEWWRARRS